MLNQEILTGLAEKCGTPSFIFDLDELAQRMKKIQAVLGENIHLCYAMKANPFLVDAMRNLVEKYEVCSPGEFSICEREKIPMERVVLSGVNKEKKDIEHVMDECHGVGIYTAESRAQFELLNVCASARNQQIHVLLRVSSGNQFGLDVSEIKKIIAEREKYPCIMIEGLQCYSGTQKKKAGIIEKEIDWLCELCEELKNEYGYDARELEYGPGLPVSYFEPDTEKEDFQMLEQLAGKLAGLCNRYRITLEMGRYFAAACGVYLTRIADLKSNNGQNYCIVDGGINHLNYYGQTMAMKIPKFDFVSMNGEDAESSSWNICGSLCTVADVIVKNMQLRNPQIGDLIIFYNTGAYTVTEGIYLFLSRRLPAVYTYSVLKGLLLLRADIPTDPINGRFLEV